MRSKAILVLAIMLIFAGNSSFANEKTPFCRSFKVEQENSVAILTAPANQRFVMRKLYADCERHQCWRLDVDSQMLLSGVISMEIRESYGLYKIYVHDFPDSCVVVPAGKTLTAVNDSWSYNLELTVIGYFEKIDYSLMSDLNGDGKVDFADFAIIAEHWLECNLVPPQACWE